MKDRISGIILFVLAAALIAAFARIESLKSDIQILQHDRNNDIHMLEQKIASIHSDVDEQLKKQASLFSNVSHNLGSVNKDSKTATLNISLVPKTIVDGMTVELSLGESTVQMKKGENGSYAASLPVGLFEEYDTAPLATIRTGGETKTEYLETVAVSYLWPNYLPAIETAEIWDNTVTFKEQTENSTVSVNGYMDVSFRAADLTPEIVFEKMYAVAETEDGEIARKEITDAEVKGNGAVGTADVLKKIVAERTDNGGTTVTLSAPFREIYEVGGSERLRIYIVAEDSLGFVHKSCAFEWVRPDDDGDAREPDTLPEWAGAYNRGEAIYDKDGNLLYGKETIGGKHGKV